MLSSDRGLSPATIMVNAPHDHTVRDKRCVACGEQFGCHAGGCWCDTVSLTAEIQAAVCTYPFAIIAEVALGESWTRDPFDRLIVSHAKANGRSALISRDEVIGANYPETVW